MDFTSDGALGDPIIIEADFFGSSANGLHGSDDWNGGEQFHDSTVTFTPVFGSKILAASGDPISTVPAGSWIFNTTDGDDAKLLAYEVATSTTGPNQITLHLPFKGSTGATKTLRVMPANPVWGTLTGSFEIQFDTDDHWKTQGLQGTGSDPNGVIQVDTSNGIELLDVILLPDTGDAAIKFSGDNNIYLKKAMLKSNSTPSGQGILRITTPGAFFGLVEDTLFDGFLSGIASPHYCAELIECEFVNNTVDIAFTANTNTGGTVLKTRNCLFGASGDIVDIHNSSAGRRVLMEDFDGTLNATRQYLGLAAADGDILLQSDTGTVRSGGSNISAKVLPSTNLAEVSFWSKLLLFEFGFYATTSSKTYDIYFKSNSTANWTASPTATELFIELEAWGHASNNFRLITKSTGVVDFDPTGGDTLWQKLSVTVAPAQAGVAYLRGWYMKPKESAKSNEFFIDLKPVVT